MQGKGVIIAGEYGKIVCREKAGERIELGELLVSRAGAPGTEGMLMQATDLAYGSQISEQNRELLSGLAIEDGVELSLSDAHLRTYTLATLKAILTIPEMRPPKHLPAVFSPVYGVTQEDLHFPKPENALFLGNLRSGSKELPVPVHVNAKDALKHHVLIAATTGRGKSNLMKVILQDLLDKDFASILVLDPHAEYASELSGKRLAVYAPEPSAGEYSLKINLGILKPGHFDGVYDWSDAQREAMRLYHKKYRETWIERVMQDELPQPGVGEGTLAVLKRRLGLLLSLDVDQGLVCSGIFDTHGGTGTIVDIAQRLAGGAVVIVETASVSDAAEVLVATMLASEVYERWKATRNERILSLCLEEAPRFIGDDVLKRGPNVFSQIAREGRKFNVGLLAITQLPSLIPRQVLANMNTKIILGIEMAQERKAIIESSPQDLSTDDRIIASLEKGEAIVTSTFTSFAVPVKVPLHVRRTSPTNTIAGLKK